MVMLEPSREGRSAGHMIFTATGVALMLAGLALFLYRASTQLLYFEFGDESEKLVGAQLMADGRRLYKDFFAHHGPLPYAIAQQYTQWVSVSDFTHIRWFNVGLVCAVALSVFLSPAFRRMGERAWATGLFVVMISSVWILIATHTVIYQAICGFLFAIMVMQMFLPALQGYRSTRIGLLVSGLAGTLVCFSSYAYGPSVMLLVAASFLCCLRDRTGRLDPNYARRFIIFVGAGAVIGTALMLAWMHRYADLKGFWIYHFLFNQKVYAAFVDLDLLTVLSQFKLEFEPGHLLQALALTALGLGLWLAVRTPAWPRGTSWGVRLSMLAMFLAAILLVNPRGLPNQQDNPFVILSFTLFAGVFALWASGRASDSLLAALRYCLLGALVVVVTEQASDAATTIVHGVTKAEAPRYEARVQRLEVEPFSVLRNLAPQDGDIQGIIFNPVLYIATDRLPASGHYYYLPWQAAYGRSPEPGYHIDFCADLEKKRPSVIWFNNGAVWDRYRISDYEPCVIELLADRYTQVDRAWPVHILRDKIATSETAAATATGQRRPSPELQQDQAIVLQRLNPGRLGAQTTTLEILFGTYGRSNPGRAELRLYDTSGGVTTLPFDLAALEDNRYHRFDIEPGRYTDGEIVSVDGGGVSVWESELEPGKFTPCTRYAYDDGTFAFTPGCPAFTP